jgi:hypothetical protein
VLECLQAAGGAEPVVAAVEHGVVLRIIDVDDHAADRVAGLAPRARRRRAPQLARSVSRHEIGEDRDRDLRVGDRAEVEPGRRVDARELRVIHTLVVQESQQR